MLKVKDIMETAVISVTPQTEIGRAAKLLLEKGINGVPVVDEKGTLVGILCQSDLIVQQKKFPVPSLFTLLDGLTLKAQSLLRSRTSALQPSSLLVQKDWPEAW